MRISFLLILLLLFSSKGFTQAISQGKKYISYCSQFSKENQQNSNAVVKMIVSITKDEAGNLVDYMERQTTKTDSAGNYCIEIGKGMPLKGIYDSIIWSDGNYYLKTETEEIDNIKKKIVHTGILRIAPELNNQYEQGVVAATDKPTWGEWKFNNSKGRRPRLITIDLTTSYANLAYPANTYPIYRHYEWCDEQRKGVGNAFTISFSENTNNNFSENTNKLGEVKLYSVPFQDLQITSTNSEIIVSISKPVVVKNHSEEYAIKGPWKFIYYIEW